MLHASGNGVCGLRLLRREGSGAAATGGATTPIEIDVATLHALPQPGCARLEVTTRQRDVLEQGKRADQELRWQVSFCRDGSFPEKR